MEFSETFERSDWDAFVMAYGTWSHHSAWLDYARENTQGDDLSFVLKDNGKIIGIVPLLKEGAEFTVNHGPTPAPIVPHKYMQATLDRIQETAEMMMVKRILMADDIEGYTAVTGFTRIITPETYTLTKGNKSTLKMCGPVMVDESATYADFVGMHKRIAGNTRTNDAWRKLFIFFLDRIFRIYSIGSTCGYSGKAWGYVGVMALGERVYYAMNVMEREAKEGGYGVALQVAVINDLFARGVKEYDMGDQPALSLTCQPEEKELAIAQFKRGFGGVTVRRPTSEKFFDERYMRQQMATRQQTYWAACGSHPDTF